MSEETLWSSMQDAPGAEGRRQEELARLAAKSFEDGGISPAEAAGVLAGEEPERTWNPPSMVEELGYDPDEMENRVMNPGTGIGAYAPLLEKPEREPLPPEKAIPDLYEKMKPYRSFLTAILEACREEATTEDVDAAVEPCYEYCHCVYTPIALRKMLVTAGALENVLPEADEADEDDAAEAESPDEGQGPEEDAPQAAAAEEDSGEDVDEDEDFDIDEAYFGEDVEETPTEAEEDDGMSGSVYDQDGYLVIEEEPEGSWKTTQAGLDYLDSVDPERAFAEALEAHSEIDDVFYDVIAYCEDSPRNITDIVKHFEEDPRLGPDTYYASYVVDRLEEIGALAWRGDWAPTDLGRKLLAERPVE